jgi:hypothetical protein
MSDKPKTLVEKLVAIQSKLKAPKSQYNSFGKYAYRNQEDILEALKPLLAEHGLIQTISDEVVEVCGRLYVKATVTVTDGDAAVNVSALAREADEQKGMNPAQITGSTSSYARKYALNGMYAIDDTKDADFTNTHGKEATVVKTNNVAGEKVDVKSDGTAAPKESRFKPKEKPAEKVETPTSDDSWS